MTIGFAAIVRSISGFSVSAFETPEEDVGPLDRLGQRRDLARRGEFALHAVDVLAVDRHDAVAVASVTLLWRTPRATKSFAHAIAAAPAPFTTTCRLREPLPGEPSRR